MSQRVVGATSARRVAVIGRRRRQRVVNYGQLCVWSCHGHRNIYIDEAVVANARWSTIHVQLLTSRDSFATMPLFVATVSPL